MKKSTKITIKTGDASKFMEDVKNIMRAADKGKVISPSHTLTFEDPAEMLRFLSATKIELINIIRNHPDSITNIARVSKRNRAAVYRDIHEMERFGLVKVREDINPGHGRHKIIELVARKFHLEAYI